MSEFSGTRPDLFFPEQWTPEQKEKAADMIRPSRTKSGMLTSIPMRCQGKDCVYAPTCPLLAEGLAPLTKPCPIETAIVHQFFGDYIEELNVDPNRLVEVSMVRDLVDQEVQYMRKTRVLAQEHFIQENVVGLNSQGEVVTKKELHQAVEFEDKIHRRREKLRNALLATRESRAKMGQAQLDTAQTISKIMSDVRLVEQQRNKALKQKLGIVDYDEYIQVDDSEVAELEEG